MEKICIVRRRKRHSHGAGADGSAAEGMTPNKGMGVVLSQAVRNDAEPPGRVPSHSGTVAEEQNGMVSFNLTAEQSRVFQSESFARHLSSGMSKRTSFDVAQREDGKVSLNFYFDRVDEPRMLKAKQVCEMLQVSRSFLGKLVKTERLKSYKVGGLRRFALEDILEFLAGDDRREDSEQTV